MDGAADDVEVSLPAEDSATDQDIVQDEPGPEPSEGGTGVELDASDAGPDPEPTRGDAGADVGTSTDATTVADGMTPFDAKPPDPATDGGTPDSSAPRDASDDKQAMADAISPVVDSADVSFDATRDPVDVGIGDSSSCTLRSPARALPRTARSSGYNGTPTAYAALSLLTCPNEGETADCGTACFNAGGSPTSCYQGSSCEDDGTGFHCVPPSYWRDTSLIFSEQGNAAGSASIALRLTDFYADGLVPSNFDVLIPDDAIITGVEFRVLRAADAEDAVHDESSNGGTLVGLPPGVTSENRSHSDAWSTQFGTVSYGGPGDLWGVQLTPAIVTAPDFGFSLAARYTKTGIAHAYVDSVQLLVYFQVSGCPDL